MKIGTPEDLRGLAEAYREKDATLYIVGGAVRDALLNLNNSDVDITGRLLQEEVLSLCGKLDIPCVPMSTRLGTLHIKINGTVYEYTPFRTERYAEGGEHRPSEVVFGVTLEEDARRRDFTVNAMYADALTGEIVDPLNGLADLEKRQLRCCCDDTLESDALRILRLIRFSGQLSFGIEPETMEQAKKNVTLLEDIVPERRWEELTKILLCDRKYEGEYGATDGYGLPVLPDSESGTLYGCLNTLFETGAIHYLFPELEQGFGMEQRSDYHAYTVLEHGLHACACSYPDLTMRLAGLLHDIGKPSCKERDGNNYMHMQDGAEIADGELIALKSPAKIRKDAVFIIRNHMYDIQGTAKIKTLRKKFAEWGKEGVVQLILMREADIRGSGTRPDYVAESWRELFHTMLHDGTPFSVSELDVTGKELMERAGIPEGVNVGAVLYELYRHCINSPGDNKKDVLIRLAKQTGRR